MRIRAEINFLQQNTQRSTLVTGVGGTTIQNNVSNVVEMSKQHKGYKGFIFAQEQGKWPATASGTYKYFSDVGYPGYMSRALSGETFDTDVNGYNIATQFVFKFTGDVPRFVTIQFDERCYEYATCIWVCVGSVFGQKIQVYNNSIKCIIDITALQNAFTANPNAAMCIVFYGWNKPFKNTKITNVAFDYVGSYTDDELKEVLCSETLFTANFGINAGIVEQYADLTIYDRYDDIHSLADAELLQQNLLVNIYLTETGKLDQLIGTYITDSWDISREDGNIGLHCTDNSKTFDNIVVPGQSVNNRTLDDVLGLLLGNVEYGWSYIDTETQEYCQQIILPNNYWDKGSTLREMITYACQLGLLNIYWYIDKFIVARCY